MKNSEHSVELFASGVLATIGFRQHVLHFPFYAQEPGTVVDWGELFSGKVDTMTVDLAVRIGHEFRPVDMNEEPYLAFAVAYADSVPKILEKWEAIIGLKGPSIGRQDLTPTESDRPAAAKLQN